MSCTDRRIHGVTRDGGYAEAVLVADDALALIPDELSAVEGRADALRRGDHLQGAGPLRRAAGARWWRWSGSAALGHLAVQFAARMGFETVAVARGQ